MKLEAKCSSRNLQRASNSEVEREYKFPKGRMGAFFKLDLQIIFMMRSESVGFALAKHIRKLVV